MNYLPRSTRKLATLAFSAAALLGACSKSDTAASSTGENSSPAPATAASGEQDLQTVTDYQLTMAKFDKYLAAQRNIALKAKDMSPAERAAMKARESARDNSNAGLDDIVKNIESEPAMLAAIKDAGLSSREFALLTVSIMQTAMASSVAKMRPNDNQDSLIREMKANPANVKFFKDNEAELTRKQKEIETMMKQLGVNDEG